MLPMIFIRILFYMLKMTFFSDIMRESQGETGENPVRARRREAHFTYVFYPMPQIGDKPLGKSREGEKI
jgi:hypothetical protein